MADDDPRPSWPDEFGFDKPPAESIEEVEPANMIATDARPKLVGLGFTDTQVVEWALLYVAAMGDEGSGDELVRWIRQVQDAQR